jgi:hypothetical protein
MQGLQGVESLAVLDYAHVYAVVFMHGQAEAAPQGYILLQGNSRKCGMRAKCGRPLRFKVPAQQTAKTFLKPKREKQ